MAEAVVQGYISLWLDQDCWDSWVGESRLYTGCRSQFEAKTSQTERVEPAMEADLAYSGGIRYRFFGGIRWVRGLVVVGGYLGL
jgi:hypothetical protein